MIDDAKSGVTPEEEQALDGISVAPPVPEVREAKDAENTKELKDDPSDPDAKLDVALDETFPTSDAPSNTRPGSSGEPAPSSGYDEAAEKAREADD